MLLTSSVIGLLVGRALLNVVSFYSACEMYLARRLDKLQIIRSKRTHFSELVS